MNNHDLFKFSERLLQLLKRNTGLAFFLRGCNQSNPSSIIYKDNWFKLNEKKKKKGTG